MSSLTFPPAIGHSTNLIGKESNIIVVRGGSRPVYDQLVNAVEEFFPESGILEDPSTAENTKLNRTSTGLSRISTGLGLTRSRTNASGQRSFGQGRPSTSETPLPLRRVSTGVSSIVGPGNGDRPGGFVLVIDGAALGGVSDYFSFSLSFNLAHAREGSLESLTQGASVTSGDAL